MNVTSNEPYFSKETTLVIKGIALLMMFFHHFLTFPSWWGDDFNNQFLNIHSSILCQPTKFCVSIFCFITGYTYFYSNKTFCYSIKKIFNLILSYWIIFLFFALSAHLINGYDYNFIDVIEEMFALYRPTMRFCWYVYYYILLMLLLPLFSRLFSLCKSLIVEIFITIFPYIFFIISENITNAILFEIIALVGIYLPVALVGYFVASHGVYSRINSFISNSIHNNHLRTVSEIILVITIPFFRLINTSIDFVFIAIYFFSISNIVCKFQSHTIIGNLLREIGSKSMLMWFVSCIFFGNLKDFTKPLLYHFNNPVATLLWGTFLCWLGAILFDILISSLRHAYSESKELFSHL